MTVLSATLLASTASFAGADSSGGELVVQTVDGALLGTVAADHRTFHGIPYAAPPVGELRWRAARPAASWSGVRDATRPAEPCPQLGGDSPDEPPTAIGSEDCLYLDVETPRGAAGPLPVMVFLHGGGFVSGVAAAYDATRLAVSGRVIAVTVSYRLGALGFLDHPSMKDEYAGNFGLSDQQAALRWVRGNIASFGGDPHNVTLWGESAGAFGVCAQLAAPGAAGLFDKAIVQSGPCGGRLVTRQIAEQRGVSTATALGCPDPRTAVACLRGKQVGDLVGLYGDQVFEVHRRIDGLPWEPVTGTRALPLQPLTALQLGRAANVPLIQGGTRDEMRAFVGVQYVEAGQPVTADQYPGILRDLFGRAEARAVLARYPLDRYPTPSLALATLLSDYGGMVGACTQVPAADAAVRRAPVYAYEFAEPGSHGTPDFPYGAYHGVDVPYFFDTGFPGAPPSSLTDAQRSLAGKLIGYWTTFARTGSPGADWPLYRHGYAVSFTAERIAPVDLAREHECGFWRAR